MADRLRAAVLGCGPTGLLAVHGIAWAADTMGIEVDVQVFSTKRKSPLYGCQYLHEPIPGLVLDHQPVDYRLIGSITGYRQKVYGIEDLSVSPGILETNHTAWDIRQAYEQLWHKYEPAITDYFLSFGSWRLLQNRLRNWGAQVIINTVPAPVICAEQTSENDCTFTSQNVWAMGDAPKLRRFAKLPTELPDGNILCSGRPADEWYRISRVFGHHTIEWPEWVAAPPGASRVNKPIKTTCTCNPEVIRSGRYGRWEKGVLAHTAFHDGVAAVELAVSRAS